MYPNDNGQKPLLNISKVSNGWVVTVVNANRDKEISKETLDRRREEHKRHMQERTEQQQQRMRKELQAQIMSMAAIGKAASEAQIQAMEGEIEPWKESSKSTSVEDMLKSLDPMINQIAATALDSLGSSFDGPVVVGVPRIETHIFTERDAMIKFVGEMLLPIVE